MIKVNILNLSGFLETINQCKGRVSMLAPDGEKVNITRQYPVPAETGRTISAERKMLASVPDF